MCYKLWFTIHYQQKMLNGKQYWLIQLIDWCLLIPILHGFDSPLNNILKRLLLVSLTSVLVHFSPAVLAFCLLQTVWLQLTIAYISVQVLQDISPCCFCNAWLNMFWLELLCYFSCLSRQKHGHVKVWAWMQNLHKPKISHKPQI